jgi:hypothetical protein
VPETRGMNAHSPPWLLLSRSVQARLHTVFGRRNGDAALIDGAGTGAARVAAGATGTARAGGLLRFFSADGEAGKLLAQSFALAFGACGLFVSQNNGFKLVVALLADVFEDRHISVAQLKIVS